MLCVIVVKFISVWFDWSETFIFQAKSHDVMRYLNVVKKSKNWESINHPVLG